MCLLYDHGCGIHPVKPTPCRQWPFFRRHDEGPRPTSKWRNTTVRALIRTVPMRNSWRRAGSTGPPLKKVDRFHQGREKPSERDSPCAPPEDDAITPDAHRFARSRHIEKDTGLRPARLRLPAKMLWMPGSYQEFRPTVLYRLRSDFPSSGASSLHFLRHSLSRPGRERTMPAPIAPRNRRFSIWRVPPWFTRGPCEKRFIGSSIPVTCISTKGLETCWPISRRAYTNGNPGIPWCPSLLHPSKLRARGFNQALMLARRVSKRIPARVLPDSLVRDRRTPPQTDLSRKDRARNVRGSLPGCPNKSGRKASPSGGRCDDYRRHYA